MEHVMKEIELNGTRNPIDIMLKVLQKNKGLQWVMLLEKLCVQAEMWSFQKLLKSKSSERAL